MVATSEANLSATHAARTRSDELQSVCDQLRRQLAQAPQSTGQLGEAGQDEIDELKRHSQQQAVMIQQLKAVNGDLLDNLNFFKQRHHGSELGIDGAGYER
mmetsp:Transcript_17905/g.39519  ORF Transcript_17905/g.39519 Transcript_17905/m.39519 type:complete len:101 (+) Transcript_17905:646-948(+)